VHELLTTHREQLNLIAQTLLEVETLEIDAFVALVEDGEVPSRSSTTDGGKRPFTKNTPPSNPSDQKKPPSLDMPPSPTPA
jgi:cell division protease FtsH